MSERVDTQTAILDVAQELIQTRGYNGFSYADIAARVGIRKPAIHYYFPSKHDLGRTLLARYRTDFARAFRQIEQATPDPRQQLAQYSRIYQRALADQQRMCLGGMLATDLATLPEEIRGEVQGFFAEQTDWLTTVLRKGAEQGVLHFDNTPEAEAQLIFAALEGAMLVARAFRDTAQFDALARQLLNRLEGKAS